MFSKIDRLNRLISLKLVCNSSNNLYRYDINDTDYVKGFVIDTKTIDNEEFVKPYNYMKKRFICMIGLCHDEKLYVIPDEDIFSFDRSDLPFIQNEAEFNVVKTKCQYFKHYVLSHSKTSAMYISDRLKLIELFLPIYLIAWFLPSIFGATLPFYVNVIFRTFLVFPFVKSILEIIWKLIE